MDVHRHLKIFSVISLRIQIQHVQQENAKKLTKFARSENNKYLESEQNKNVFVVPVTSR